MQNGYLDPRKRRLSKTPSKVETFENGCLSYQCIRAKTKVFENADVMNSIIGLPRRTKTYRFLIASVDGYLYPFSLDQKRRHTKTHLCGRSLIRIQNTNYANILSILYNIMLLWFVNIYERNLKKLQFTTQRFDTPV